MLSNNKSTFDALVELLPREEVLNVKDARGWTLLHFAAKSGFRHAMKTLLDFGAKTEVLTAGTDNWVTDNLEWERLTIDMIAEECGYIDILNELKRDCRYTI